LNIFSKTSIGYHVFTQQVKYIYITLALFTI